MIKEAKCLGLFKLVYQRMLTPVTEGPDSGVAYALVEVECSDSGARFETKYAITDGEKFYEVSKMPLWQMGIRQTRPTGCLAESLGGDGYVLAFPDILRNQPLLEVNEDDTALLGKVVNDWFEAQMGPDMQ